MAQAIEVQHTAQPAFKISHLPVLVPINCGQLSSLRSFGNFAKKKSPQWAIPLNFEFIRMFLDKLKKHSSTLLSESAIEMENYQQYQ